MNYIAIPLWRFGQVVDHTIVDQEFAWLRQWKWRKTNNGYATRGIRRGGRSSKYTVIWMHRVILGDRPSERLEVDHINRNKLDNRKANLRWVPRSLNLKNIGIRKSNTSGYTGVSYSKEARRWAAYSTMNKKRVFLGRYLTKEQAAKVREDYEASL